MTDRIIALIDMDCFYCQVEARLNPDLKGKPMAVVQYNTWKGGGIIAVNYEARDFGVTRHLRGNQAKEKCPEIVLVQVPEVRGKADLTKYRDAGCEVVTVLSQFSNCVERASVDEAYIDLTQAVDKFIEKLNNPVTAAELPNTFIVGYSEESNNDENERSKGLKIWLSNQMLEPTQLKLAVAGVIVEEMRAAVFTQTEFRCSAGIGHNKVLSKLVCGLHKPNRQTILPHSSVAELYRTLSVKKVRHLGGKLGDSVVELLGCKVMSDLEQYTEAQLQGKFDIKNGSWLYNIARGIDHDPVTPRLLAKSIGCCKAFRGIQALTSFSAVEKWTLDLSKELEERLVKDQEENKRKAKLLCVSFVLGDTSASRRTDLKCYSAESISSEALELIRKSNGDKWSNPIKYIGLSAGNFADELSGKNSIQNFFKSAEKLPLNTKENKSSLTKGSAETKSNRTNNSFFMKYFKNKCIDDVTKMGEINAKAGSSKGTEIVETKSRVEVENNDLKVKANIERIESKAGPSTEADILETLPISTNVEYIDNDDSTSDSVKWTSLGEIFPNINTIDESVAALLPPLMRKQLEDRKRESRGSKKTPKSDHNSILESGFFSKAMKKKELLETITEEESTKGLEPIDYHLGDSTDIDDVDQELPQEIPASMYSGNEDSRESLVKEDDIPGQLCDKCSKHVILNKFAVHMDFHAAEELHRVLNSSVTTKKIINTSSASTSNSKKNTDKSSSSKKRGRPSKNSLNGGTIDKKMRSITSYFTPS